jgi:RNA polymerase sigma factor FliA
MNRDIESLWKEYYKEPRADIREALLEGYIGLVKLVYARLKIGLPLQAVEKIGDDLINAGVIGLIQAFEKFDPRLGNKFATFASHRIRGAMLDELRSQDWISKQRRHLVKELQKAYRIVEQKLGRSATDEEIADHLGKNVEEFRKDLLETGPATLVFLDGLQGSEKKSNWNEFLASPEATPEQQVQKKQMISRLACGIEGLPDTEKKVLKLFVYDELGQKEIAEAMGVTPSRVSQLYSKAVLRLQGALCHQFS